MKNIQGRIDCWNKIDEYADEIVPKLIEELKNNPPKFKTGGQLYKKNSDSINKIIGSVPKDKKIVSYVSPSGFSSNYVTIHIKSNYPTGDFGCEYCNRTIDIWDEQSDARYIPRERLVKSEVDEALENIKILKEQMDVLENEMTVIKSSIYRVL